MALRYLAEHHDPASVMFVDGWTGKGAITRELTAALESHPFSADLAVLADPGRCTSLYGTRDDYLIPSACLNSTVSGLVSRTVLNDTLIGPGDFHGAKFYRELVSDDVSAVFLDAVCARFPDVAERVAKDLPDHRAADRAPDWSGWEAVRRCAEAEGIDDLNLVKPGIGETTRCCCGASLEGLRAGRRRARSDAHGCSPTNAVCPSMRSSPTGSLRVHGVHPSPLRQGSRSVTVLVCSDLDRTLIYSQAAFALDGPDETMPRLLCVEFYQGAPLSYMTESSARTSKPSPRPRRSSPQRRAHQSSTVASTCWRSPPAYAICANGGHLLVDGEDDPAWAEAVRTRVADGCAPLADVQHHLAQSSGDFVLKQRTASDLFAYTVVDRTALPANWVEDLTGWCAERGWRTSLQGRKVYCLPACLTRAAAAEEVPRRGAVHHARRQRLLLDIELLEAADRSIRPAHGELHDTGWTSPATAVTTARGIACGEEIAEWLLERATEP